MTDATMTTIIVALLAALPPTVAAIGAAIASYAALKQARLMNQTAGVIVAKTDQIHILTNSNLTTVKSDLETANQLIKELQLTVTKMTETKGVKGE